MPYIDKSARTMVCTQPEVHARKSLSAAVPWLLLVVLAFSVLFALSTGRYPIPVMEVVHVILAPLTGLTEIGNNADMVVIWLVRMPRILLAALIGSGLALAGAALQSVFRNPLADPQILGVSSGAALGGVFGIVLAGTGWPVMLGAFIGGIGALAALFWLAGSNSQGRSSTIMLVLAGLVVGAVGAAGIALVKFAVDPENQLPAIVFWLMGSLAGTDAARVWIAVLPILLSSALILGLRFHLMALAVGEDDAKNLGIPVRTIRLLAMAAAGLITAASVAACGIVGWVGLVVPHVVRLGIGSNYRLFFLNTALVGASYLILVDTAARTLVPAEIPLGALTALLGAPIFAILLRRMKKETDD